MVNLTDRTPRTADEQLFDPDKRLVTLFAAANETISFQAVLEGGPAGARDVRIHWGELTAPKAKIGAAGFRAFRCWPVKVSDYPPWYLRLVDAAPQPASFYDALIPADSPKFGEPYTIGPNERLVVWVDLYVPRSALPGRYRGQMKITAQDHQDWSADVALQVYDFVLPDERPLAAVGGFDDAELFEAFVQREGKSFVPPNLDRSNPQVREGLVVMRQLMRLAHEHRLDLFDKRIRPALKRDMAGAVRLNWEDYDAIVGPYVNGSAFEDHIGCPAWPAPFSDDWPDPKLYGGLHDDAYASVAASVIAQCRQHASDVLQMGQRAFLWPYRGEIDAGAYEKYATLARIARAADPETAILTQLPPEVPQLTGWTIPEDFRRLADIYAPPAHWLDPNLPAATARADHPLAGVWLSPGLPPYLPSLGVIATAADVRAIPWFAMKYKCTGLFLPEVMHWEGDVFATAAGAETRLFYPGKVAGLDSVLPSVRLKRLRRGLQDLAYLWLLRQRARPAIAQSVIDSMTRYAALGAVGDHYLDPRLDGWVQDGAVWVQARRLLAEEVQEAVHPSAQSNDKLLAQRLKWKEFDERTHTVRVEQVRCRVTPSGGGKLQAAITLDLYNDYARPSEVQAALGELPEGWTAVEEARKATMPAASREVITLAAQGRYVPAAANGKMAVPVDITMDMRKHRQIEAEVPFIQAGIVRTPMKIDGQLDDWPLREGNSAADFKLIGRRGQRGDGKALRQTVAFVVRDDKNLYIALRCDEPNPSGMVVSAHNILRYQQLMACGEDLVEVILDPGAAAAGPEDLYHIAIKPSGVLLTERGVHTDPPLGKARPWPVAASVAIGRQDKLWVVELAIPLEAFGDKADSTFWGINFTRFATQGDEASSWSGAPRYFYDPRNLGTMFITPLTPPPPATSKDSAPASPRTSTAAGASTPATSPAGAGRN